MKDLVLFGMQGSGKGTQGAIIMSEFPYMIFEAGAELRKLAAGTSALGKKVKRIIEGGNLVPDDVIMEIVGSFVGTVPSGQAILFDGIPRNRSQGRLFEAVLAQVQRKPWGLFFKLSEPEAMKRLMARRICSACKKVFPAAYSGTVCDVCGGELIRRADDNPESIRTRIRNFERETLPVIEWYRAEGRLIEIDGNNDQATVAHEVQKKLRTLK